MLLREVPIIIGLLTALKDGLFRLCMLYHHRSWHNQLTVARNLYLRKMQLERVRKHICYTVPFLELLVPIHVQPFNQVVELGFLVDLAFELVDWKFIQNYIQT